MSVFDQTWSLGQLREYQLAALNRQLQWAAERSRFYAGLRGRSLRELDEIAELPFTTAADLLERGGELLCLRASQVRRVVSLRSSGSGGRWKRLAFSDGDIKQTVDFFAAGMRYLCAAGQRVLICMPGAAEDGVGRLLAQGLEQLGARPLLFGPIADYQDAARCLGEFRPHTIVGIPAQIRRLALTAPQYPPHNVLLSADRVGAVLRQAISRLWGCAVFEHYGLTESGLGYAVECPYGSRMQTAAANGAADGLSGGMHLRHDALYTEIVEPDGGQTLAAGQWGEIVLTTLTRQATPLLRYRSGDWGRLLDAPCGCGSVLPRLQVAGRIDELRQPLSVYALDDILLADDRILDYAAVWQGDTLRLSVAGDLDTARRLLAGSYPDLPFAVEAGTGFMTRGTIKRSLRGRGGEGGAED
ncbi:MAG: phenylacetate--CoA ligase family protein [Bacillota bacterium]|nr:phenylacetate--CoA ligase family protein [Bacillota bacterium]